MNILIALVVLGFLSHLIGDLAEESTKAGETVKPIAFIKARPYRILMSIIGSSVGFLIVMVDLDKQLTAELYSTAYTMAFGIGYASDSVINKIATIATNKMEKKLDAG